MADLFIAALFLFALFVALMGPGNVLRAVVSLIAPDHLPAVEFQLLSVKLSFLVWLARQIQDSERRLAELGYQEESDRG